MLGDSEETGENEVKTHMEGFDLDRRNPSSFGKQMGTEGTTSLGGKGEH